MLVNVAPRVSLGTRHVSTLSAPFFRLLAGARAPSTPPRLGRGGGEGSCRTGGQTLVRSARAEENRGMHLRILPRNAAGVRNGTSLPLEKHPTPRGIKSFGIRVYATATVQSVVADFYLSMFPREETSSRDARLNNEITAYSNYFPLPSSFSRCLLSD